MNTSEKIIGQVLSLWKGVAVCSDYSATNLEQLATKILSVTSVIFTGCTWGLSGLILSGTVATVGTFEDNEVSRIVGAIGLGGMTAGIALLTASMFAALTTAGTSLTLFGVSKGCRQMHIILEKFDKTFGK